MGLATEDANARGSPAQFNRVANEGVTLGHTCLTVRIRVDARPGSQTIVTIATHGGVTNRGVLGALREVHAIGQVVTDASVLNDHAVGVEHLAGVHVVAHPEATLKVLDPHVGNSGIVTGFTGESLVLSLLVVTRLQVRGHGEVGQRLIARAMIEDDAATLRLIRGEEDVGVPQARALEGQTGVANANLAREFPGSCGNVDRLGRGVRSRVHGGGESRVVSNAIAGSRIVVVGNAHGAFGALDGRCGLLELNEVDAVGVLIVANLDDLNMITLLDLTAEQSVNLVETEARPQACSRLVVHAAAANVLPGALGGEVEGSDRLIVDAHINATGGVIRQRETQIEGIGSSRRREVDRGVLVIQGHVGLARGLNSRRFEVIGALERRPVGAARLLGLVSRVGDARTVLIVGGNRTGDECRHQRDNAEQSRPCDEGSSFHMSLKPLFMP